MNKQLSTVIFDVDDTLYDQHLPFKQALVNSFDYPFTETDIEKLYLLSRKYSDDVFDEEQSGKITTEDLQVYRITASLKDLGYAITKKAALRFQEAYVSYQNQITLIPEIKTLLDYLNSKQINLAVLTNGNTDHQQMKITQLGIDQWINPDQQFISGSLPFQKPDPRVFDYIVDTLKLNKDTTCYIGDAYINDVLGAKSAGLSVVWFNHRLRTPEGDVTPDFSATTAEEVLAFFKSHLD
ncbi:putative hydrolase of the HAD superfamily [Halolactibacillus halophilus]|uniref:Hydrolase n=1 Tax=Halolactibacillus halophilus TaxID=306540 RepID=A0A1I5LVX0_9BACI|nr:HAD family hydrolase [Halolactibacillus halophilus]GEM00900.1 hydrolase [Halolactibacillus halophilus]SFP01400.1 putative hydrolase of the HAD superfamily [Halolactibacillus halophilus]